MLPHDVNLIHKALLEGFRKILWIIGFRNGTFNPYMSLIDEQLARLAREHGERNVKREAERAAVNAPQAEIAGVIVIAPERERELMPHTGTLAETRAAFAGFDFENGPVSSFLELLLAAAVGLRASDVHVEPQEAGVAVRLRIDGLMNDAGTIPSSYYHPLSSRLKLLARMKLNADRPQDGRFSARFGDAQVEVRVSSVPSQYGETVVMRVLDPKALQSDIGSLGLREDDFAIVMRELSVPNGMILNTGPTGSGKTTTLYSFLKKVARPERKAITIEDPIEYAIAGMEQTQVDEDKGYSFATGLRAIVRQDPDIILVGEIRDKETAEIAMQAALTGHQVFSTVHANDAAGAIPRLVDMGVTKETVGPAVNLIMGQRLVRRLCDKCKKPAPVDAELASKVKKYLEMLPARVMREGLSAEGLCEPVGCDACGNAGYRGRIAVFELFPVNADAEKLIASGAGAAELAQFAGARGMVTMQQDGVLKALHGITTVAEIEAATGPIPL